MNHNAYDNQLYKALGTFKQVRNWPDLNGCLQSILDVFQKFSDVPYVSHKLLFAKTLSQCLSPALPAGIQGRTLEVYHKVFERAGQSRLARDIYVWAPGLFLFFHGAGIAQRSMALKLFNEFFTPLIPQHPRIAPPFILSILPGINDEGTEVQSCVASTLSQIKAGIGHKKFWRAQFRAALTHPAARSAFLTYALKEDPKEIMESDSPELIQSMILALFSDPNILVVRGSLELFNTVFSSLMESVKITLGEKAIQLLSIEDQSIRRRVFAWMNSFSGYASSVLSKASIASIQAAIEKGPPILDIVVQCLATLVKRPEFASQQILSAIDPCALIEAAGGDFDAILRMIPFIHSNDEEKRKILRSALQSASKVNDLAEMHTLCKILGNFTDLLTNDDKEISQAAAQHIFDLFKEDEESLLLAMRLIRKLELSVNFASIVKRPIPFVAIKSLFAFSKENLQALLVVDQNAEELYYYSFEQIKKDSSSKTADLILQLYEKYPAQLSISLANHFDQAAISAFILSSSRIPFPILPITVKANNPVLLRALAFRSSLVITESIECLKNETSEFSYNLFSLLLTLRYSFPIHFFASMTKSLFLSIIESAIGKPNSEPFLISLLSEPSISPFLAEATKIISSYVISHPSETSSAELLKYLPNLPLIDLVSILPKSPLIFSSLVSILSSAPSSEDHFKALDLLFSKCLPLATSADLSVILDFSSLLNLTISRCTIEVSEMRSSFKSSGLKRLLGSSDPLSPNDCLCSLSLSVATSLPSPYSSILPRYLQLLIYAIPLEGFSQLFASIPTQWRLSVLYAFSISKDLQKPPLISFLLSLLSDNEILLEMNDVLTLVSYDDKGDRSIYLNFLASTLQTKHSSLCLPAFIQFLIATLQQIKFSAPEIIHIVSIFFSSFPSISLTPFTQIFLGSIAELRSSQADSFSVIDEIDPLSLTSLFGSQNMPSQFTKFLVSIEKTDIHFATMIGKFCHFSSDGINWAELIISLISDKATFSKGNEFLRATAKAIHEVSASSEKFASLVFEMLSETNSPAFWKTTREGATSRSLQLLSFVLFCCTEEAFTTKQQQINSQLMLTLSGDSQNLEQFRAFSLFMRVIFVRGSQRFIESFSPILSHELIEALSSDEAALKGEAIALLKAVLRIGSAPFQFGEFAFLPDILTFGDEELGEELWPILRDSKETLTHLKVACPPKEEYEGELFEEFLNLDKKN